MIIIFKITFFFIYIWIKLYPVTRFKFSSNGDRCKELLSHSLSLSLYLPLWSCHWLQPQHRDERTLGENNYKRIRRKTLSSPAEHLGSATKRAQPMLCMCSRAATNGNDEPKRSHSRTSHELPRTACGRSRQHALRKTCLVESELFHKVDTFRSRSRSRFRFADTLGHRLCTATVTVTVTVAITASQADTEQCCCSCKRVCANRSSNIN